MQKVEEARRCREAFGVWIGVGALASSVGKAIQIVSGKDTM